MRTFRLAALAATALLTLGACGGDPLQEDDGSASAAAGGPLVVGSADFTENIILAEIYAQALEAAGVQTETNLNIGSRETYIPGLRDGSIDLIPEYTGALLVYLEEDATPSGSEEVYAALQDALPESLTVLEPSDAEDKDALVVTQETAEQYDLEAIPDLKGVAGDLVLGGPPEFQDRVQGVLGLRDVYGIEFSDFQELDTGTLSVTGLQDGDVDVANIFTTNPAIEVNDFVVLEDPEDLFSAQNIVPLIRSDRLTDEAESTLNEVSDALTTEGVTELIRRVDIDKENPDDVAGSWLEDNGLV
ncbi:MAG: ABC transporter substrate-binding protein [Actinomycetota bacterium]|nr:ABC transporter substrate-binding protein [Actinomycetota bacterium]